MYVCQCLLWLEIDLISISGHSVLELMEDETSFSFAHIVGILHCAKELGWWCFGSKGAHPHGLHRVALWSLGPLWAGGPYASEPASWQASRASQLCPEGCSFRVLSSPQRCLEAEPKSPGPRTVELTPHSEPRRISLIWWRASPCSLPFHKPLLSSNHSSLWFNVLDHE